MANFEQTITQIRNILRSAGITGMESINHCIAFIIIKYMTTSICEIFNIPTKFSYENLKSMIESDDISNDDIYKHIYNKNDTCIMHFIHSKFKFTNIKFKLESIDNLIKIIKLVDTLDLEILEIDKDIIGTIYELHLKTGSAGGGMRDLGQYFTHRAVIKYMIELCNPKMIGDKIEKIIDPTCGTGGFLTMTVKYLNEKYPNIDWEKNSDKLIGFDLDVNVVNITKINLLIESKTFMDNIICRDTLYNDMKISDEQCELMGDVLLCNEPMGIMNLQHANCCDRIKNLKIRGTKAEPLFLQLFMEALNENGRCAVVVPDGVLFNESNLHQGTRKKLIEEFNLVKVITLNHKEFFLNTDVKTSILYFENNGKTTKTIFSSISLSDDVLVEEHIMDIDYDTLVQNNYSLFINKYKVSLENRIDGIEYKKLGDICEIKPKGQRNSKEGLESGKYPLYFCSILKHLYLNEYDFEDEGIMINNTNGSGKCRLFYCNGKYSVCQSVLRFASNDTNISTRYIYYYLSKLTHIIKTFYKGTNQKQLDKFSFLKLEIPIPSLEVQNAIVEQLDVINENNSTCQKQIVEFKKIMKYYVETNTLFGEEKQLGDILQRHTNGKTNSNSVIDGDIPFYSACAKNPKCNHNSFDFDDDIYLLFAKSGGNSKIVYSENLGIGKFWLVNGKSSANVAMIKFTINKPEYISYKYFMNIMNNNLFTIQKLAYYTTGNGNINMDELIDFKIKVVSPDEQQKIVDYCDNLQMMIDKLEENIENNNILMKTILENKLKQQTNTTNILENNVSDTETTSQDAIDESLDEEKLTKLSVPDLKKLCKEKKIQKYSKMKKVDLIKALKN